MRRLRSVVLSALALLLVLGGCGPSSCSKDGGTGTTGGHEESAVDLVLGQPTEFQYAGEKHSAELVRVGGLSAEVVISSSAGTYVLTEGDLAEADLDDDSLVDCTLSVSNVKTGSARLVVSALEMPAYDETDFTTVGGLAPYRIIDSVYTNPSLITLDDGSHLLLYVSSAGHRVQWERYRADGTQILAPELGAGRMPWSPEGGWGESYDAMDAARVGDAIHVAFHTKSGMFIARFGLDMHPQGAPAFLSRWSNTCALATDGEKLWMAAQEPSARSLAGDTGVRSAVAIMTIAPGTPPLRSACSVVTDPPAEATDAAIDIAVDEQTGLLAVPYVRFFSDDNSYELRVAIVDSRTTKVARDVLIAGDEEFGGAAPSGIAVFAEQGRALLYWETADALAQRISTVDLNTGTVRDTYAQAPRKGIPGLIGEERDLDLVRLEGKPAILFLDKTRYRELGGTIAEQARYVLQPIAEKGPAGTRVVLDGGQPILADVTFDLGSLRTNPKKAVCGSPCLISGKIINRGSRDARGVVLETSVGGASIGTLNVGTLGPGEELVFAKVWDVPADLTAESVDVVHTLSCADEQYTLDNDSARTRATVLQKGVVHGRVTNASGAAPPDWWAAGLEGVEVSFGGKTVLTDTNGCFAIEDVEFGSGTLTATKEGFNQVSATVATARTTPIASVGIRMDNHGTLVVRVTDDAGEALAGVQSYLVGFDRSETTDSSGKITLEAPFGAYRIAFRKAGYQELAPQPFEVRLGETTNATVVLKEATAATLTGRVIDRQGTGVAGARVTVVNSKGETAATLTCDENGHFDAGELPVKPSGAYKVTATGAGLTVTEPISLSGGEVASAMIELVPDRGELAQRDVTEGYTSWMIKAAWPGFLDVSGQAMYVWYGNYAVRVGAQYWDGDRDLNRVEVTTWGGKYETHATKGEVEFPVSKDDLTGTSAKKLPPPMGEVTDAAGQSWFKKTAKSATSLYKEYSPAITLGKEIYAGAKKVKETFGDEDEWLTLGQGPELLTWKESLDDFKVADEWDWEHPLDSAKSLKEAIPTSFAIPVVIGGASVQNTAVRVDGIDVVDKQTGEVYYSDRAQWFSFSDDADTNSSTRTFDIGRAGVPIGRVRIFVWVTVQKYWNGEPAGTCFDQREQQLIVFDPDTGGQKAFIAPGDMYLAPGDWSSDYLERLAAD
ncbi:MAG: carboxypeptidase-like regulatory domain-containing protein [Actinomycetia bacterium]|nr:carboxypeptidase-like regulatory domain-containing protein [Actinomycetes bacterium]